MKSELLREVERVLFWERLRQGWLDLKLAYRLVKNRSEAKKTGTVGDVMTVAVTIVWQLSVVLLAIAALLTAVERIDVIAAKVAFTCNKLIDALLELEDK
jgi:hypothetical protein